MRRYNIDDVDTNEYEDFEVETNEYEIEKLSRAHFESTYSLKPNELYEVNKYSYETDRYGRIKRCEGHLRLEKGKRNTAHQTMAGGEYRLETDEGGHLIGRRFGGSERVDNLVPMGQNVNRYEYKELEDEWAKELEAGNKVDVKISCKYEAESTRPKAFIVKYKVTERDGFNRIETRIIYNLKSGGDLNE